MSLYQLIQDQEPIDHKNWTEKQKLQYRFGGIRYSLQGTTHNPSDIIPQINGNYAFPNGDQDVSQIINQETLDRNNQI